jgi:DNA repair protein RecO
MTRAQTCQALILKRHNIGEADRVVTLLTRERGKLTAIAKSVRKFSSSQRAFLEPGNLVRLQLITTHTMPLITQTVSIQPAFGATQTLDKYRQLTALLEMFDRLSVEEEGSELTFDLCIELYEHLKLRGSTAKFRGLMLSYLEMLGFYDQSSQVVPESITEFVSHVVDQPIRAWEYLKV